MVEPNTTVILIFAFVAIPVLILLLSEDMEKRRALLDDDDERVSEPAKKTKPRELSPQELREYEYINQQRSNRDNYRKKYPHLCYVCKSPIDARDAVPLEDIIQCSYCGKTNVILRSGASNTPERVALYKKYDGFDGDWRTIGGLIGKLLYDRTARLDANEKLYRSGAISEEQFKRNRKDIKLENNRKKKPFEKQKQEELLALKKIESSHRKRVILRKRS
jgi:hypothetical protein